MHCPSTQTVPGHHHALSLNPDCARTPSCTVPQPRLCQDTIMHCPSTQTVPGHHHALSLNPDCARTSSCTVPQSRLCQDTIMHCPTDRHALLSLEMHHCHTTSVTGGPCRSMHHCLTAPLSRHQTVPGGHAVAPLSLEALVDAPLYSTDISVPDGY